MQTPSLFQVNIINTYKAASMVRVRQKIDDRFNPKKFEKKKKEIWAVYNRSRVSRLKNSIWTGLV
jgi:hypothetical protein